MQVSYVREIYPRVQRTIAEAVDACQLSNDVPDELRDCLAEMDREAAEVPREFDRDPPHDNRIVERNERLEKLGDRALRACRDAGNGIDEKTARAVKQAHDVLSDIKHRLH